MTKTPTVRFDTPPAELAARIDAQAGELRETLNKLVTLYAQYLGMQAVANGTLPEPRFDRKMVSLSALLAGANE